jgi:hypothetical protein
MRNGNGREARRKEFGELFAGRVLDELKPLLEARNLAREGIPRMQQILTDEENRGQRLEAEIEALNKTIVDALSEGAAVTKDEKRLRGLRLDLQESQARLEGLKGAGGMERRENAFLWARTDLQEAFHAKTLALREEAQKALEAKVNEMLDLAEGWDLALDDALKALEIPLELPTRYRKEDGTFSGLGPARVKFLLDPRTSRLTAYVLTAFDVSWTPSWSVHTSV